MKLNNFSIITNKKLIFQEGALDYLPKSIKSFGHKTVLITGGSSLKRNGYLKALENSLRKDRINFKIFNILKEPEVSTIDQLTLEVKNFAPDCIVGIGGGSALDAAKAISAMSKEQNSILEYLEGVGSKKPSGKKLPFIAVPTTAGTGSEATFNAVIKGNNNGLFKKSLRHENYIADTVIIDPLLYHNCQIKTIVSSGLDTIAQLIESYISTKSFPFTDNLVLPAFEAVLDAFSVITNYKKGISSESEYSEAWRKMAYGAYISGISLSNAGLCVIHGMAGTIGGMFNAPHGALCGTLLSEGLYKTIEKLEKNNEESPSLLKLSNLGYIAAKSRDILPKEACLRLVRTIENIADTMDIPRLSAYGIRKKDLKIIAERSSNKNNPIELDTQEIISILERRL